MCLFDPYYVKKKKKSIDTKKKKQKPKKQFLCGNKASFRIEMLLKAGEETTKAAKCLSTFQPAPATTIPYPLSQNQHQKVPLAQDINSY